MKRSRRRTNERTNRRRKKLQTIHAKMRVFFFSRTVFGRLNQISSRRTFSSLFVHEQFHLFFRSMMAKCVLLPWHALPSKRIKKAKNGKSVEGSARRRQKVNGCVYFDFSNITHSFSLSRPLSPLSLSLILRATACGILSPTKCRTI